MPKSQAEVLLEANVVERIRTIFLQPRPHVSIAEGTTLLGVDAEKTPEPIRSGEIEVECTASTTWIWRAIQPDLCRPLKRAWMNGMDRPSHD